MKRPDLNTCTTSDMIAYIDYLEGQINGTSELVTAVHSLNRAYAKEITDRIAKGKLLKDVEFFKQSMSLIANIPKFKGMYVPEVPPDDDTTKIDKKSIFESIGKKVKDKIHGG